MSWLRHLVYIAAWGSYAFFAYHYHRSFGPNVLIPLVGLVAIATWLYNRIGGLLTVLFSIPAYMVIAAWLYNDGTVWFDLPARSLGISIEISVVYLIGYIKNTQDTIRSLNLSLDKSVVDKTKELNSLTTQLIEEDEEVRIELGQDVHDGLGQYLTGILLYSNSLEEALRRKGSPDARQAKRLMDQAQKSLQLARLVSRTLFPIRISETGLEVALDELVSYFNETTDVDFTVQLNGCQQRLSNQVVLHVYRIVYEGVLDAMNHARPSQIHISLREDGKQCRLRIEYDGVDAAQPTSGNMATELMTYRAQQFQGTLRIDRIKDRTAVIRCSIPCRDTLSNEAYESEPHA